MGDRIVNQHHSLVAFVGTLIAIVILALSGALVCILGNFSDQVGLAKAIAALGFISSAASGLVGVIGTFRPRAQQDAAQ